MAALFGFVALGCNGGKLHEARSLARALEQFSHAAPVDRPRALAGLEAVFVTDATVIAAKTECVTYARKLHEALTLKDEVAVRVGDVRAGLIDKSDPIAITLPTKLDAAERSLKEAVVIHAECRRLLAAAEAR